MEGLSVALAETIEAEFMHEFAANAPVHDRTTLGITTRRHAGGVVLSARADSSGCLSRTIGLGFEEPITADLIDEILDFYWADDNSVATLQIAPTVLPEDWDEIRRTRGLHESGLVTKYAASIEDLVPHKTSDPRITPVRTEDAGRWVDAVERNIGILHAGVHGLLRATIENPMFHAYALWDSDIIVAAANLFVKDGIAFLSSDAPTALRRPLGSQSALIAAGIDKARQLGCRRVVGETEEPTDGPPSSSRKNMLHAGFKVIYNRPDYVWRKDK